MKSSRAFQSMFNLLNESNLAISRILIEEHQAFKKLRSKIFFKETSEANDIKFLVSKLQGKIPRKIL